MKKLEYIVIFVIIACTFCSNQANAEEYQLGPRDVLSIGVYGFEDLQVKELIVRDDGRITFPLVGEIDVRGLSPAAVSRKITDDLQGYVNNPKVTVNVIKFRSNRIYVLGEVVHPGLYELERQPRLLDAIGIAGGYTKDAAKKKVAIIHISSVNKPIEANLLDILTKGDMTQNYALADGDIVYLSNNGRIDFNRDILPFLSAGFYIHEMD